MIHWYLLFFYLTFPFLSASYCFLLLLLFPSSLFLSASFYSLFSSSPIFILSVSLFIFFCLLMIDFLLSWFFPAFHFFPFLSISYYGHFYHIPLRFSSFFSLLSSSHSYSPHLSSSSFLTLPPSLSSKFIHTLIYLLRSCVLLCSAMVDRLFVLSLYLSFSLS